MKWNQVCVIFFFLSSNRKLRQRADLYKVLCVWYYAWPSLLYPDYGM